MSYVRVSELSDYQFEKFMAAFIVDAKRRGAERAPTLPNYLLELIDKAAETSAPLTNLKKWIKEQR